jgi:hypothetical protein
MALTTRLSPEARKAWLSIGLIERDIKIAAIGQMRAKCRAPSGDGRNQCARQSGRHRQGAGVAWACNYCYDANLWSPTHAAEGQPDVQGELLKHRGGQVRHA